MSSMQDMSLSRQQPPFSVNLVITHDAAVGITLIMLMKMLSRQTIRHGQRHVICITMLFSSDSQYRAKVVTVVVAIEPAPVVDTN